MPRALDVKQPAADHDPTRSGTEFHLQAFQDIDAIIAAILAGALETFKNLIIPAIEELTGIDLSLVLAVFDDLDFDFSDPVAFLWSLINAILALPEILAALLGPLIDAIIDAFNGVALGAGSLLQGVWDVIAGLFGMGDDAQATATSNAGEIAAIKAGLSGAGVGGGLSIIDDFDRPVATTLTGYTQIYSGAGAGTEGTDGGGYCHWSEAGSTARTVINRHNTPLTTNTQYASFVLRERVGAFNVSAADRTLRLRCDTAATTGVGISVGNAAVTLSCTVAGAVTVFGSATGLSLKAGDFWELLAGTAAEPYRFIVKCNGSTVVDYTDAAHVSQLGASYLYPAFGGTAGVNLFLLYAQYKPPDVGAFSAADRTG